MSRGLTTAMVTASKAHEVRPAFAVFLDLASGPIRLWTGHGTYTWGGNAFSGVGTLGQVSPIQESKSVVANGITLALNGVPSDMIALALTEKYRGRKVYVWLWLFDASNALIADPIQIFRRKSRHDDHSGHWRDIGAHHHRRVAAYRYESCA
jgi:hypothetical protein